jgi:hypothetical protein
VRPQRRGFPHEPKAGLSDLMFFVCFIWLLEGANSLVGARAREKNNKKQESKKAQDRAA